MNAKIATAALAAVIMVGCDGTPSPAGAGAGTGEGRSGAVSDALARERALESARSRGLVAEVQLSALIVDAAQDFRIKHKGKLNSQADQTACALGVEPERQAEFISTLKGPDVGVVVPGLELGLFMTEDQAFFNASCLAYLWAESFRPTVGWPQPRAPRRSDDGKRELRDWSANMAGLALGTSNTMAPIARHLANMAGATTLELRETAKKLLLRDANSLRETFTAAASKTASRSGEVSRNLTGSAPAPIHFTLGELDYQHGPAGPQLTRYGTPLFGGGYIDSERYTVEAITSSGQSMTQRSTATTSSEASSTATISAEARTK